MGFITVLNYQYYRPLNITICRILTSKQRKLGCLVLRYTSKRCRWFPWIGWETSSNLPTPVLQHGRKGSTRMASWPRTIVRQWKPKTNGRLALQHTWRYEMNSNQSPKINKQKRVVLSTAGLRLQLTPEPCSAIFTTLGSTAGWQPHSISWFALLFGSGCAASAVKKIAGWRVYWVVGQKPSRWKGLMMPNR